MSEQPNGQPVNEARPDAPAAGPDAELAALAVEAEMHLATATAALLCANRLLRQRPELAPRVQHSVGALLEVLGLTGVAPFFDNPRVAEAVAEGGGPARAVGELHVGPGAGLRRL